MSEMTTSGNQPAVTRTFSSCDMVHHRLDVETLLMFNHQRFQQGGYVRNQVWFRVTDNYGRPLPAQNPASGWWTFPMSSWLRLQNSATTLGGYVGYNSTGSDSVMWTPSEIDYTGQYFRGPTTIEVWVLDQVSNGSTSENVWSQSTYRTTSSIAGNQDTAECFL